MGQYIHHVPGRIRIRSNAFHCEGERAAAAQAELLAMDGIRSVQVRPRSSSLIVQYDPQRISHATLFAALEDLGCMAPVRRDTTHVRQIGETFGKALVGAVMQKAVEQSARSLVTGIV
ncbi:HMA2 domain-containing protein [uncultured Thiohalocapsa sp.]|uniref:HMA2 domain-containing protein n=1 Tax=uncultured Thiohalocapsa sp. TaxID=768990 RepID=UPI0025DC2258|nr:heavy-metal-associated domain-containing protein [uncultured Thiohalocapsa sp.]